MIAEEAERRAKEKKAFGEELERDAACQLKRMLCVHRVLVIHGSLQVSTAAPPSSTLLLWMLTGIQGGSMFAPDV